MKLGRRRLMQEIPQHSKNTHMIGFISQNVFRSKSKCISLKVKMYFAQSQNVFCSKAKCILSIPPSHKLDIDFHPALVYWYTIIQNVSVKYFECFVKCVFLIMSLVCYVVFFKYLARNIFKNLLYES